MKNILIIGDSWAIVPCNMWSSQSLFHKHLIPDYDENVLDWLDFKLMSKGHKVTNRSFGGCQNYFQLGQADAYLNAAKKHNFHIDIIIWFHTEICRDMHFSKDDNKHENLILNHGLEYALDQISMETYEYATKLYNLSPTTKWAIIGGHAPLRNNTKHLLNWANFRLDDYRSYILDNISIAECQTLSLTDYWDTMKDEYGISTEDILKEFDKREFIQNSCKDKTKFYDEVHPSCQSNQLLSNLIIEHFNL